MALVYFEESLEGLQDALPSWWSKDHGEMLKFLTTLGLSLDQLSAVFETLYADSALSTATLTGLSRNYAYAFGLQQENLPAQAVSLRAYIAARASENGSLVSLVATLVSLLKTPVNTTGAELVFAADGSGLTFPADGSGLTLFQATSGSSNLIFPINGAGLVFPTYPTVNIAGAGVVTTAVAGSTPIGAGPGLLFPLSGWLDVAENYTAYSFTVTTKSYLSFDRAAFARAVERFRLAHLLPATIVETNS